MFSLHSETMNIFICLMCLCCLLPVEAPDNDRYSYCESCLTAARELEKILEETPAQSRDSTIKRLLSGQLCEKLLTYNHEHVSKDKMKSSCRRWLDSHHDQFHAALVNKEQKHLDMVLCYEQTRVCLGIRRQSFEDSKTSFRENDIDALLQDNRGNVRVAHPVHAGSSVHRRDEM